MTVKTSRYLAAVCMIATAAASLVGCGVPGERTAREMGNPDASHRPAPSVAPSVDGSGAASETLFLVRDNALVAVTRRVPAQPTVDTLMRDLIAGPTSVERDCGMTSALLGTDIVGQVRLAGGQATVRLSAGSDNGRTDEVLALGQLVCTLAGHPGVDGVSFTRDGKRVSVPRGDGTLSPGPLTAADYTSLISPSPSG